METPSVFRTRSRADVRLRTSFQRSSDGGVATTKHVGSRTSARTICSSRKIKVRFTVPTKGGYVKLVGSSASFGSWNSDAAHMLQPTADGLSYVELDLPANERFEYKYVHANADSEIWESGDNRILHIPPTEALLGIPLDVCNSWDDMSGESPVPQDLKEIRAYTMWEQAGRPDGADFGFAAEAEIRTQLSAGIGADEIRAYLKQVKGPTANSSPSPQPAYSEAFTPPAVPQGEPEQYIASDDRWLGREITFMRSNDHQRDRQGTWDTSGLSGPASAVIEGDQHSGSWRQKLEVIERVIAREGQQDLDALAYSAIYLSWVGSGAVACVEDGGHHRPCRHAELARSIFCAVENKQTSGASPEELLAIRRLHPWLPSFTEEFTASVPLTRIRDIAHRSDIPHDLKQEIKHTIQNKLHRNAGPEDLVATEIMLKRIVGTGPQRNGGEGHYPEDFVNEFKKFHRELKDFFNASSLEERLERVRDNGGGEMATMINNFLAAKAALGPSPPMDQLNATLDSATALREHLCRGLEHSIGQGESDGSIADRQQRRLAELELEKYAFVLLSQLANKVAEPGQLVSGSATWVGAMRATKSAMAHLALSAWEVNECNAVANDLQELLVQAEQGKLQLAAGKDSALRLMAMLERTRRLAEGYSEAVLGVFLERAAGGFSRALGVDEHVSRIFCESEIRASVVFQLSKLCSAMLKGARTATGASAWDALVAGDAEGTLVEIDQIVPGALPSGAAAEEGLILLVRRANGDEEVMAAGEGVRGVILCQELPHLSHLGVRARQEKVVFATCEEEDTVAGLRSLAGQRVRLQASSAGVQVSALGLPTPRPVQPPPPPQAPLPVMPPAMASAALSPPPNLARSPSPLPTSPAPVSAAAPALSSQAAYRALSDPSNPFKGLTLAAAQATVSKPSPPPPAFIPAVGIAPNPSAPPSYTPPTLPPLPTPATLSAASGSSKTSSAGSSDKSIASSSSVTSKSNGGIPAPAATPRNLPSEDLSHAASVLPLEEVQSAHGGAKSAQCGMLLQLAATSAQHTTAAFFKAPPGVCLPYGAMELAVESAGLTAEFEALLSQVSEAQAEGGVLDKACEELQALVMQLRPPVSTVQAIGAALSCDARLIVRSSANVEDLEGMSGAGLYDSIPNVRVEEPEEFGRAVAAVWASLYTRRAVLARRAAGVAEGSAVMAVLVQQLLAPNLSFVLHTAHPLSRDPDVLVAEIAVGLGETLASGSRGSPWRLSVNKLTGEVQTLALANLSEAMVVDESAAATGELVRVPVDYSSQPLSTSLIARATLARCLAEIGSYIEEQVGSAQDIEGAVVDDTIFIVQSRPQP